MENITDKKIEKLLEQFDENKKKIKNCLEEFEELKSSIIQMFPKKMDMRNKFLLEERIKTTVEFNNTILKFLQELNKVTKEEIELRRKLQKEETEDELEANISLFRKMEKYLQENQTENTEKITKIGGLDG